MLGLGVMLNMLRGNKETVEAMQAAQGRVIVSAVLDENVGDGGALVLRFENGATLQIYDRGQSCCESRYMTTDDDLSAFVGSALQGAEVADGPDADAGGECHETQFLKVSTSLGVFTCVTHNEHNGYYGGFCIEARYSEATP